MNQFLRKSPDRNLAKIKKNPIGGEAWKIESWSIYSVLVFIIVTTALLSFLTSFDEVIIAIFVSGGSNATLTKHMFSALRDFIDPTIAAISTIMILVSTTLLLATQFFGSRQK